MGTDIHVEVEKRIRVVNPKSNHDSILSLLSSGGSYWTLLKGDDKPQIETRRNYNWFALLAGVRAGHGIGVEPIVSKNRGLPNDLSEELKDGIYKDSEYTDTIVLDSDFDIGDHSFTYATVQEIRDFNWSAPSPEPGLSFIEWIPRDITDSWAGDWVPYGDTFSDYRYIISFDS